MRDGTRPESCARDRAPPEGYLRVVGDVSLDYALEQMQRAAPDSRLRRHLPWPGLVGRTHQSGRSIPHVGARPPLKPMAKVWPSVPSSGSPLSFCSGHMPQPRSAPTRRARRLARQPTRSPEETSTRRTRVDRGARLHHNHLSGSYHGQIRTCPGCRQRTPAACATTPNDPVRQALLGARIG